MSSLIFKFNELEYKDARRLLLASLFSIKDGQLFSIVSKRDLLVIRDELKVYIQLKSANQNKSSDIEVSLKECPKNIAASYVIEGKMKKLFKLKNNGVIEHVFDEDSFLEAIEKGFSFYTQV